MWINPKNPNVVIAGDDGGLWRSEDGGTRWKHQINLPISQFYHVSTDNSDPYHVYGGLQDNSSWVGDSSYPGGITNSRWENMFGGDGFWMFEDTADPKLYLRGGTGRRNRAGESLLRMRFAAIKPLPNYGEKKLRFNWNAPIHMSPNEKGTLYIGAQFLFRSRDHGQTWDRISPDLTTNDPEKQKQEESGGVTVDNSSAEMHTTIYSISESPKNGQIIWVGTDDGNVQITRDGGKTWTNVVGNVAGLGKNSWVSTIEASRFDEATAYATFDRHTFGDMKPYAYKTTDYGKTWTALPAQESGVRGFAHVIKEDSVKPELLFLGTEFGLWISNGRRPALGAIQRQQFPCCGGGRYGGAGARERSGAGDARARDLDHRRHFAATSLDPGSDVEGGSAGSGTGYSVLQHLRRLAGGRRELHRPQPAGRGADHLLPARPAHLWRFEDRDSRPKRQAG